MTGRAELLKLGLVIGSLLLAGCNPEQQRRKTSQPRIEGTEKMTSQDDKIRLLKQVNRKFEDPDAHFRLGQIYHAEGRWDEAEYHYKTAMSFDPVYWPAQAATVRLLQDGGNIAKAMTAAEIYMGQVSTSADRSVELGKEFLNQNMYDYALACLRQALRLDPKSAEAHKQLGYYYLSQNDQARAKQHFELSFKINRYQPDVAFELGWLGAKIEIERKPVTPNRTQQPDQTPRQ
ncbi:MAG: tetratricopeptide repeat protein [Planctomycetota bacterium]|jgi:Tfp pilus assembly protein PilF